MAAKRNHLIDTLETAASVALIGVAVAKGHPRQDRPDRAAGRDRDGRGRWLHDSVPNRTGESAARRREPATTKTGLVGKLDLFQQRHGVLAFPVAVMRKFSDDRGGRLAALVAYYSFFSIFPAMLALVTILGFVLEGHPALRADIADSALGQFPIIGESIGQAVSNPLVGSPLALTVGIVGALWAGLGALQAAQDGLNEVWDVPAVKYPNFVMKRVRSLAMLVFIGILLVVSTAVAQAAGLVVHGPGLAVAVFAASLVINIGVFMVAFRVLTVAPVRWGDVLPGAVVGAIAYTILQAVGRLYIEHSLNGASKTYGTFAVVIGLLSWIYLIAQMTMIAAEVDVVRVRQLWPRSLFGEPATSSDERSVAAQAQEEQRARSEDVDVEFAGRAPTRSGR